jgi:hypothetical protein
MASFAELGSTVPDLADRARAVFSSTTNAVLGTIRRDGTPRLSGIDPFFHDGELHIGSMPGARKGADLRRDPRLALHSIPWESRRLKDGADDPGDADVKLAGTCAVVTDPAVLRAIWKVPESEPDPVPGAGGDLFVIDVRSLAVISVVEQQLVIDRWSETDGRQTIRRS